MILMNPFFLVSGIQSKTNMNLKKHKNLYYNTLFISNKTINLLMMIKK